MRGGMRGSATTAMAAILYEQSIILAWDVKGLCGQVLHLYLPQQVDGMPLPLWMMHSPPAQQRSLPQTVYILLECVADGTVFLPFLSASL